MPVEKIMNKRVWTKPRNNLKELQEKGKDDSRYKWVYDFNLMLRKSFAHTFMKSDWQKQSENMPDTVAFKQQNLYDQDKKQVFNDLVQEMTTAYLQKKTPKPQKAERAPLKVAYNVMADYVANTIQDSNDNINSYWNQYKLSTKFIETFNLWINSFQTNGKSFSPHKLAEAVNAFDDTEFDVWNIAIDMWHYRRRMFHLHWSDENYLPYPDNLVQNVDIKTNLKFYFDVCKELGVHYKQGNYIWNSSKSWTFPHHLSTRQKCAYLRAVYKYVVQIEAMTTTKDKQNELKKIYSLSQQLEIPSVTVVAKPCTNTNPFLVVLE